MSPAPPLVELLLLRHGIAEERGGEVPDAGRRLTPEGIQRTSAVVARLVHLRLGADVLLTSPLIRARQTAELAVQAGLAPALQEHPALVPAGAGLDGLSTALAALHQGQRLLLVGHEPDLGDLAARLVGAPPGSFPLKKAGVALLEGRGTALRGGWRLRLLMGPRQLLDA